MRKKTNCHREESRIKRDDAAIFQFKNYFFIPTATGFIYYISSMPFLHTYLRKYIILLVLAFCTLLSHAQKNDYIWLSGYGSALKGDSVTYGAYFGITKFNFNNNPLTLTYDSLGMNFDFTDVAYSDNDGNLLFYTNGIYVANALDEVIQNSMGLNNGWLLQVWDPTIQNRGYRNQQGILALPKVGEQDQYYLIHSFIDSLPGSSGTDQYVPKIMTSLLDLNANALHGITLFKNQSILDGYLGPELSATKHANGRDWWIVVQKRNTNCYYKILLDQSGFYILPNTNCGGDGVVYNDIGSCAFSPDGSKYANFNISSGIKIFDFDRCAGELSNPVFIPLSIWPDSQWLGNGVAFSPNSRFLYVSATKAMLQYDTWAADIAASVDTVGWYDGFASPFGNFFSTAQLAPNGKIYISCGNGTNIYHVINNPDEKGAQCNFAQHSLILRSYSIGLPYYPNYRLGALAGSACDTLTSISDIAKKEKLLKVFPNPATDAVTIDYGYTNWEKGDVDLEITNAAGQIVYTQHLPMYSGFQRLNVSQYASGVYNVAIKRSNSVVAVSQFVKK